MFFFVLATIKSKEEYRKYKLLKLRCLSSGNKFVYDLLNQGNFPLHFIVRNMNFGGSERFAKSNLMIRGIL